jgi:Eisosome protein 1
MAHRPSLSKSTEQAKMSPSHALRAASAADRDSGVARSPSLTYYRNPEESARIQKLATELARRDLAESPPVGGVRRSDLTRVATISMAKKAETDKVEAEKAEAHKRLVQEEAMSEWSNSIDLDDAARRIVAERIARVTLTGDEGDEVLAGKAAGESIHRGDKRVKDWERVLKQVDDENKSDKAKNYGWLRQSMRKSDPTEPSRNDPALIMEAAKRNVKTQLDGMDKTIAEENMIRGKPMGEHAVRKEASTKELQEKGDVDLQRVQKERASIPHCDDTDAATYDIGGLIMTHEQVEAIAQKHVNEVLAEINEKVEREKERIETERIDKETKAREKQHEKDLARERAAEEKAEKDRIKAEQREQKAEEKRVKEEAKAAERKKKEDALAEQRAAVAAEKKRKDDEKKLKVVQAEQLAAAEGLQQYDKQKETEPEEAKEGALKEVTGEQGAAVEGVLEYDHDKEVEAEEANEEALKEVTGEQGGAVEGVLQYDHDKDNEAPKEAVETANQTSNVPLESPPADAKPDADDDAKGGRIKSWFKSKVGRRLSRNAQDIGTSPSKYGGNAADEDIYGEKPKQPIIASNWTDGQIPADPNISTEESVPRADSLKEVALAKHETSDSHEIEHVHATHETVPDTVDEDEFVDAPEEIKERTSPYLGVEEDGRKGSSERGSRFKEEF